MYRTVGLIALLVALPCSATELKARVEVVDRPMWIPLYAYSNECMYGELWHGNHRAERLPTGGVVVKMLPEISKFWRGGKYKRVSVVCTPLIDRPGQFQFTTKGDPSGPRGWLQDMGYGNANGWVYRYWFDQRPLD